MNMKPAMATKAVITCIKANQSVMLHGSPGIGKSDIIRAVAKLLDRDLIDLRLSQLDPVDLRGTPSVDLVRHRTSWNVPNFFPEKGSKSGILFLDELPSAPVEMQAAAYQLILDRRIGDYELPDNWAVVAAGNRMGDQAIVNKLSTALRNRLAHIELNVDFDDWVAWAIKHNINPNVLAFLRYRSVHLNEFEPRSTASDEQQRVKNVKDALAFATPRTWQFVSNILKVEQDLEVLMHLIPGIVGIGAATEFLNFMTNIQSMPDLDAILANPDKHKLPTEISVMLATVAGLAAKVTPKTFDNGIKFISQAGMEVQATFMRDVAGRNPQLISNSSFIAWATKNSKMMF